MPFRVERSSADIRDGFYGAVRLLLFESGSKPVDAGIAVHLKRACVVGDGVSIRENEDRRVVSSANDSLTNFSISGVKANLTSFRRSALIGRSRFGKSGKNLR